MEPVKDKSNQGSVRVRMPRQNTERYVDSASELRGIFKELRERLFAIAESETRASVYGEPHPDHQ
jgi:hypothetical protein